MQEEIKIFFNKNGNLVKLNDFKDFQCFLEKMIGCKNQLVLQENSFSYSLKKFQNKESLNKYLDSYKIK